MTNPFSRQNTALSTKLVEEYFFRNEPKKEDDKWLKDNKPAIVNGLAGKARDSVGAFEVVLTQVGGVS